MIEVFARLIGWLSCWLSYFSVWMPLRTCARILLSSISRVFQGVDGVEISFFLDLFGFFLGLAFDLFRAVGGTFNDFIALDQFLALFFGKLYGAVGFFMRLRNDAVALVDDLLRFFDLVGDWPGAFDRSGPACVPHPP